MDIGFQLKMNVNVRQLMLSGKQTTERNNKEFAVIFEEFKSKVLKGARNKCLNIQLDLQDKHNHTVMGMNGSY